MHRLIGAIGALEKNPFNSKKLSGNENYYRIRVGDFRIIFELFQIKRLILIQKIGKRENIYSTF